MKTHVSERFECSNNTGCPSFYLSQSRLLLSLVGVLSLSILALLLSSKLLEILEKFGKFEKFEMFDFLSPKKNVIGKIKGTSQVIVSR